MIKLSKITILYGLWILVSATFMRQLLNLFTKAVGPVYASLYIEIILLILGLIFVLFLISRKSLTVPRLMIVSILITFGFFFIQQLTIIVEKLHILEYGLFGWLVCRDLLRDKSLTRGVLLSCAICLFVGSLDEIIQAILPYRVFDLNDIRLNLFGSLQGLVIYILSER